MFENTRFPKAKKYWYMGRFYDWSQPVIHPMCHALHYGSSVFEGIRAYKTSKGPAILRLPEHIDRLFLSASALHMKPPYNKEEITEVSKLVVKENQLESAYIRPLLFFSYGNLGLVPKTSPAELVIAAWEWGAYLGKEALEGVRVKILHLKRIHHSQTDMRAKVGGLYALSTIAGLMAREEGYNEAIFLNLEGNIAEGPGENIFIVKDNTLKTNDTSESILEGITRTSVLEIAQNIGIKTSVGPITKEEFVGADELFFAGTAVEIAPITHVSDDSDLKGPKREYTISSGEPGEITKKIIYAYREVVEGRNKTYEKWLTYVYD